MNIPFPFASITSAFHLSSAARVQICAYLPGILGIPVIVSALILVPLDVLAPLPPILLV